MLERGGKLIREQNEHGFAINFSIWKSNLYEGSATSTQACRETQLFRGRPVAMQVGIFAVRLRLFIFIAANKNVNQD